MSELPFGIDLSKTGVYQITNTANGNRYIGSSVNIWTRWKTHTASLRRGKHHNAHLQGAWNLYSEPCFVLTPLILCERFELARYEQAYLDIFKPEYNETVNVTAPMRGMKFTEEHKAKIGNANIGNKGRRGQKNTEEHRHKISEALTGKKLSEEHREKIGLAMRGKTYKRSAKVSDETREKLRLSHLGYKMPEEQKRKIGAAQKANPNNSGRFVKGSTGFLGYKHTEESKKKMSESLSGENSPNYGKHPSAETRAKIGAANSGRVLTEEHKRKISEARVGRHPSSETRAKMSVSQRARRQTEKRD